MDSSDKPNKKIDDLFFLPLTDEWKAWEEDQGLFEKTVSSESYDLNYTCLLISRFPSHQLKDDLAEYLPKWLDQICRSYGWQLEYSSVQDDYFQWTLRVNASVPPVQFMQAIRYETSKYILSNFEDFAQENLTNDFWAPGYLLVLGTKPHPSEMIEKYIRLTRRHQGLESARLAGDETTDAPPPDVKKKKSRKK